MKNLLFLFFFSIYTPSTISAEFVNVNISNIKKEKGVLYIAIFSKYSNFPKESAKALALHHIKVINSHNEINYKLPIDNQRRDVAIAIILLLVGFFKKFKNSEF